MKAKQKHVLALALLAVSAGTMLFAAMCTGIAVADRPALLRALPANGTRPEGCVPGWSIVPSPNVGSGNNSLASVAAISANDVWAVGYYTLTDRYQTLTEHWD